MKPYIYIRALKHVDYTVFCVNVGQKTYWDTQFGKELPFASGQQVKRSIINSLLEELDVKHSPVEFVAELNKNGKLLDKEIHSACDPSFVDQLIGGWMMAGAEDSDKVDGNETAPKAKSGKKGEKKKRTLKRRSPLSISAMRPLHPLLAGTSTEGITFDRSNMADECKVILRDASGNELTNEEIIDLMSGTDRSLYRRWIPNQKRATGLFVYDIAIDLRTLFCVSLNQFEPEIDEETVNKLKKAGWKEGKNAFGQCLILPKDERKIIIPALANALLDWHITSNQSRTFSLMETMAVAISDNANAISSTIRAKLIVDGDRPKAKPVVEGNDQANLYVTPVCSSYIETEDDNAEALKNAKEQLVKMLFNYQYENR